jgi:hypothetical protein
VFVASIYNLTEERRYPVHILKSVTTGVQHVVAFIKNNTVRRGVELAEACSVADAKTILGNDMIDSCEGNRLWKTNIPLQSFVPAERSWVEHVAEANRAGRKIRLVYFVGMSMRSQSDALKPEIREPFKCFDAYANGLDNSQLINQYTQSSQSGYRFIDCSLEVPPTTAREYDTFTKSKLRKAGAIDVHIAAEFVRLVHVLRDLPLLTNEFHVGLEKGSIVRIGNYDASNQTLTVLKFKNMVSKTNTGYFRIVKPGEQLFSVSDSITLPPPA